ncbi:sensor histidine kinase [Paenibacillus sp. FSL H8-0034]|uniref:sensor histidine kinase n=1 Tax=Paenibacillus sp. FSL H8-0034 TaxID=2954671 RepID=UPI0030F4C1E1
MNTPNFIKISPDLRFQARRFVVYVILILIPFYMLSFFFYQRTVAALNKELYAFLLETLTQSESNISYKLNSIREMSNIVAQPELRKYLSDDDSNESASTIGQQLANYYSLNNLIDLNIKKNSDIFNIRIFVNSRYIFSREKVRFFQLDQLTHEEWYQQSTFQNKQILWRGTYLERSPFDFSSNEYIYSIVRVIHPLTNMDDIIGVLFIDVLESNLYSVISTITQHTNGRVYIVDPQGNIISAGDKSQIGSPLMDMDRWNEISSASEGSATVKIGETNMIVVHKEIPITGWHIVNVIPENMLQKSISLYHIATNFTSIVFVAIILLLSISFIYAFISGKITSRIRNINRAMKLHNSEYLGEHTQVRNGISKIEISIHQMIHTIQNLTKESYEAKLRVKEAQLKVLQAQINPHFLYNTLDTLKWMSLRNQTEQIGGLIDALAEYYRKSLNKGEEIVTLSHELKLIQVYLDIQQLRTDQAFHYELNMDESLASCKIPKLIVQPIIENALYHGIWQRADRTGSIYLHISSENGKLSISVTDSGIGIAPLKVEQIKSGLRKGGNYGLYNVNERICLFFGEAYGIDIESEADKGTKVTLHLAVRNE